VESHEGERGGRERGEGRARERKGEGRMRGWKGTSNLGLRVCLSSLCIDTKGVGVAYNMEYRSTHN